MGITECSVYCPLDMNIPILPHRNDNGKIIYPTGVLTGVWTHELLSYAISEGYVIMNITKQYVYTEKYPLFREYVTTLYKLRQEYKANKNPEQETVKLLMNSLYGKFGQKPTDIYDIIDSDITTDAMNKKLNNGFDIQITGDEKFYICTKKSNKYPKNSFPILSAYVTSYGQITLHKLLKVYKPLYCDTDSIMTMEKLPDDIISNVDLGKLKLEKLGVAELYAPKCYAFNNEPTLKGVNLNSFDVKRYSNPTEYNDNLSTIKDFGILQYETKYNVFKKYIAGELIEQQNFMKLKSSMKSKKGYLPNEIIKLYKSRRTTVSDKSIYTEKYSIPIELKI